MTSLLDMESNLNAFMIAHVPDIITTNNNVGLVGSYLTSLATLQGEGRKDLVVHCLTTGAL